MSSQKRNKITVICTANVCRSPMGERILAEALKNEESPLAELEVVSAGVAARYGSTASPFSIKVLEEEGIDLNDHCSQPLTQDLINESLLLLCMTLDHASIAEAIFDIGEDQINLYRGFMESPRNVEIPDPFGGSLELYQETLESIKEGTPAIVNYLKTIL